MAKNKKRKLSDEERQKLLDEAKISNNFVFMSVMKNETIAKKILEIVLGVKIRKIKVFEYEKTIDLKFDKKGIRMDVYLEGSDTVYNIEMQVENKYNLTLRARFYGSLLDLNKLKKGQDYKELPTSYIIFICLFDPFDKGQAKYVFSNQCELDNGEYIQMGDKTYKVFLNAKDFMNTNDKQLKDFLGYIATQQKNNKFIHEIHDEIDKIKSNKQWGIEYMTFMTNYMDDIRSFEKEIAKMDKELKQERKARKQEQEARKHEQEARKQEQKALKQNEKALKQALIKQLEMFDDSIVAQINCMSLEEVAKLRIELLGE